MINEVFSITYILNVEHFSWTFDNLKYLYFVHSSFECIFIANKTTILYHVKRRTVTAYTFTRFYYSANDPRVRTITTGKKRFMCVCVSFFDKLFR